MSMERVKEIENRIGFYPTERHHGMVELMKDFNWLIDTVKQQNEQIEGKDQLINDLLDSKETWQKRSHTKDQRIEELEKALQVIEGFVKDSEFIPYQEMQNIIKQALNK